MTDVGTDHFLLLSAVLFIIGMMGVLIRRNMIIIFMCVELMLTAANITLVAFAWENNSMSGQSFVVFTIAVAAAEAAVGLAIILALSRRLHSVDIDDMRALRD
jgi:NADH-quinone oxidoreductase subunit K